MKKLHTGFTLLELMVTVAIGGIVLAIGLPAFSGFIKSSRLTTQTNDVLTSLHVARNEAVNRGHNIRILTLSGNADWSTGWEILLDINNNGTTETEDIVLRNYDAIESATLDGVSSVTFESTGYLDQLLHVRPVEITLEPDECNDKEKRLIIVHLSGLVTFTKEDCP